MSVGRFTILGCGSSGGVPRLGNQWGACDPENPKNRRLRCAGLVERYGEKSAATRVLVDTGPDIREQLLAMRVSDLDAVLYTHDHADHTHGIDDLRVLVYLMKRRIDCWYDAGTGESLRARFGYCFEVPEGRNHPAILNGNVLSVGEPINIEGEGGVVSALPIEQEHGWQPSIGYRFGSLAYSPDVSGLSDESAEALQGLDVWIVDALRHERHPAHFTVKQAVEWIERLKPKRAILTHLHVSLDYEALKRELPANVIPAHDGLQIEFDLD